jgi:hypothetical protein
MAVLGNLMSPAFATALCDRISYIYDVLLKACGTNTGAAVSGNVRGALNNYLALVIGNYSTFLPASITAITGGSPDANIEQDLLSNAQALVGNNVSPAVNAGGVETFIKPLAALINDLNTHCGSRAKIAPAIAAILDFPTFMTYYGGGAGAAKFANMVTKSFADTLNALVPTPALNGASVLSPAIHPNYGALATNGMGLLHITGADAGTFTAGSGVTCADTTKVSGTTGTGFNYPTNMAEVNIIIEVTVSFAGGSAVPKFQIPTGVAVDDQGAITTLWTQINIPLFGGSANNPAAALPQQTISSGAISAGSRVTVTVGSTTGIVVGSVVQINKSSTTGDQEYVVVETVNSGTTFTAVFKNAHTANATVDGNNSLAIVCASAGKRCRGIGTAYDSRLSNPTIGTGASTVLTTSGHTAGDVRIVGVQDRVGV